MRVRSSKPPVIKSVGMVMSWLVWGAGCRDFDDPATSKPGPEKASAADDASEREPKDAQASGGSSTPDARSPTNLDASTELPPALSGPASHDWSTALDALYTFEDESDVGKDSSGHGWHLAALGTVELVDEHVQGSRSASFVQEASLWSNDTFFRTFAGTSFTLGGWVRARPTSGAYTLLANGGGPQGGFALRITTSTVICEVADGKGGADLVQPRGPIGDFQDWTHLVCRYDDATKSIQLFVNGVALTPSAEAEAGIGEGSGHFAIGNTFDGELDEVLLTYRTLSNEQITRIWGCGVDGKRCSCSDTDPAAYTTCGPLSDCSRTSLPPCDSALLP